MYTNSFLQFSIRIFSFSLPHSPIWRVVQFTDKKIIPYLYLFHFSHFFIYIYIHVWFKYICVYLPLNVNSFDSRFASDDIPFFYFHFYISTLIVFRMDHTVHFIMECPKNCTESLVSFPPSFSWYIYPSVPFIIIIIINIITEGSSARIILQALAWIREL